MFSAYGRHQADRNIFCPWNSSSLPHPVSTTHILLANCTASEIICARTLSQFTSTRTTQRDNASSTCHFPMPVIPGVSFPSCHLYLSCSEHWCVIGLCWSLHSRNGAALHSAGSTLSVRGSAQSCLDVPKGCDVGTGPILPPLKTFLQGQGHSVTDSQDLNLQNCIQQLRLHCPTKSPSPLSSFFLL